MTVTLADQFPLYEALFQWRLTSQHMRWDFYARKGVTHSDQEFFYDQLIQRHEDIVEHGFASWWA